MSKARGKNCRKLLLVLGALLGLASLLGLSVFFLRSWSLGPEEISERFLQEAGGILGCKLEAQKTEVFRFPFPRVVWQGLVLSWARGGHAKAQALEVSTDPISMAVGRLGISSLQIDGLDVPETSWRALLESLRQSLARDLGGLFFHLGLSNARVKTTLAWQGGLLQLTRLEGAMSRKPWGMALSLGFDLECQGRGTVLKGVFLEISPRRDAGLAFLRRLSVEEPRIELAGGLRGLSEQGFEELFLKGASMDLKSAGIALQMLWRDSPICSQLPNIIGAGKILDLEIIISGTGWEFSLESVPVAMRGRLQGAELVLPGPWGVLKDLKAGLQISQHSVELSNMTAKTRAGILKGGSLSLELLGPQPAFYLDVWVEAQLQQLHRILEEWVQTEPWSQQLKALYRVGGKARGKVVAQGPVLSPRVWVQAQDLSFQARHKALPYGLEVRGGTIQAGPEGLAFQGLQVLLGSSTLTGVSGSLDPWSGGWLDLRTGACVLELEEIWALLREGGSLPSWLENFNSVEGRLSIQEAEMNGPPTELRSWQARGSAHLEARVSHKTLGTEAEILDAELEFTQESISLKRARLILGKERLSLEGDILEWLDGGARGKVRISGEAGPKIWGLLREPLSRVTGFSWREPARVELLHSQTTWGPEGTALEMELAWEGEASVWLDLLVLPGGVKLRQLKLEGGQTRALFSLDMAPGTWELSMEGHVSGNTLSLFLEENPLGNGWLQGKARIKGKQPLKEGLSLEGELLAGGIPLVPYLGDEAWGLIQAEILGKGHEVSLPGARIKLWDRELLLRGEGFWGKGGLGINAILEAPSLQWVELGQIAEKLKALLGSAVQGTLGIRVGELKWGKALFQPFHADLELDPWHWSLDLRYSVLCGMSLSGTIQMGPEPGWAIHPVAKDADLRELLGCLGISCFGFTGRADLEGEIGGEGVESLSVERVSGSLGILFHQGEIHTGKMWLNILETLKGLHQLGDWAKKAQTRGIPLDKGRMELEFRKGDLKMLEFWSDGKSMRILAQGDADLLSGDIELTLLLEPKGLKSRGSKVNKLAQIVALDMKGPFKDPKVQRLKPEQIPEAMLEKLDGAKATKTKSAPSTKARRSSAR
ncbi:MAG: AsmA-like C-terminal region-containing protein [bacterium]